jgi:hypothetical protein
VGETDFRRRGCRIIKNRHSSAIDLTIMEEDSNSNSQCEFFVQELSKKKLQILRQALFEWVDEHPDYRFSVSTFGSVMRIALENYMNRHQAEFMSAGRA